MKILVLFKRHVLKLIHLIVFSCLIISAYIFESAGNNRPLHSWQFGIIIVISFAYLILAFMLRKNRLKIDELSEAAKTMFQGSTSGNIDLTRRINYRHGDNLSQVVKWINRFLEACQILVSQSKIFTNKIAYSFEDVSSTTQQISASSQEITSTVTTLTGNSFQQKEYAEKSSENLAMQVNALHDFETAVFKAIKETEQTDKTANHSVDTIVNTMNNIENVFNLIDQTGRQLANLTEVVAEISQITETISKISTDTNLLALNAAIEAARAGDAGNGFAVVAEEVRHLAESSSKSSIKISELISSIQAENSLTMKSYNDAMIDINQSRSGIGEVKNSLTGIIKSVDTVKDGMQNISHSFEPLVDNINKTQENLGLMISYEEQNNQSLEQISASVEQLTASIGGTANLVQEVNNASRNLTRIIKHMTA